MTKLQWARPSLFLVAPLALLMLLTRTDHFGSAISLPDASLAVFFALGFYFRSLWLLPLFIVEAVVIDYLAISYMDASDFCLTPAYGFLVPTYAVMWWTGRFCGRRYSESWHCLLFTLGAGALAASIAFLISNGSFYLLSGHYQALSWQAYSEAVARYYGPYVGVAMGYILTGVLLHGLLVSYRRLKSAGLSA